MSARLMTILLLIPALVLSAIGVVFAKHESRKLFVELQTLVKEKDEMNIEWGQLQIEQSTWATHNRIESEARERLGMIIPPNDAVVIVRP